MTNEEFPKLVLEELGKLSANVSNLSADVNSLSIEVTNLSKDVANLSIDVTNIKGQLSETNQIVHALRLSQEEMIAQVHNLSNTVDQLSGRVANIEKNMVVKEVLAETEKRLSSRLDRIGGDVTFLVRKIADHDDEIRELRAVK